MTITPANHFDRESVNEQVDRALEDAVTHLADHFEQYDRDMIRAVVQNSYVILKKDAQVHQHLVTLAEHRARLVLDGMSQPHM